MHFNRRTKNLFWCCARWADYGLAERTAVVRLLRLPYLQMAFPTEQDLTEEFNVAPGTSAYRDKWAELLLSCEVALAGSYTPHDLLYTLFTRSPAGDLRAVATMATGHGERDIMLADAIGDPESSIPTLRMLLFRADVGAGIDLSTTPEYAVREFMRLCVIPADALGQLVCVGAITESDARYVAQHGLDEMLAGSFFYGRVENPSPAAFIFNVKPRLARVLERKGLGVHPLFSGGVEPSPRVLSGGAFSRRYFDWAKELTRTLPPEIQATGTRETIHLLVRERPELLLRLAISLPYLFVNNAALAVAMTKLADRCGFRPPTETHWLDLRAADEIPPPVAEESQHFV